MSQSYPYVPMTGLIEQVHQAETIRTPILDMLTKIEKELLADRTPGARVPHELNGINWAFNQKNAIWWLVNHIELSLTLIEVFKVKPSEEMLLNIPDSKLQELYNRHNISETLEFCRKHPLKPIENRNVKVEEKYVQKEKERQQDENTYEEQIRYEWYERINIPFRPYKRVRNSKF